MLRSYIYYIMCLCLLLLGCDRISEAERLVYEKPEPARRVVLIEDFTGQRCVNCPKATDVIEELEAAYGDNIVAVGIHGGPLSFAGNAKVAGLKTALGDEYYSHWKLEYQPVGLIDRRSPAGYTEWSALVKEELSKPSPLRLEGTAVVEDGNIAVRLEAEGTDGTVEGKLQVWILEDGIQALQLMPDGTANQAYIHNHVFRTAVNGIWGQDFSIREGETASLALTQPLHPDWNPQHLSVVAFVHNAQGVQQAVRIKVPFNTDSL